MPAAAVIRRIQALSGFAGCKGAQADLLVRGEISQLNCETAFDTASLESRRELWNSECSSEMCRYSEEHQRRRQQLGLVLTLRHESMGIKQD